MAIEGPVVAPPAPAPPGVRPPAWRFWLPLAVQLAIVAAVPAPAIWAHATGTTVLLRTAPVDPYDVLRGRYMRLGYADAASEALRALPGGDAARTPGAAAWLELAPGAPGAAWRPVRLHGERPAALPAGHAAIRGTWVGDRLDWGLGSYYIPEDRGDALEAAMRAAPREAVLVEVRVDAGGGAVLERLRVQGRPY